METIKKYELTKEKKEFNLSEIKDIIWANSKPAGEYSKDWYVIPALDVIEILEKNI